ncbi:DUF5107 domain-containing protein [Jeotgalibacillus sp. R-1-5s-1]|uniref:aldose epimerase family protein n=1 Tax=Jeotgalibacillus sp. R-1-5s-1 TaxID=2555897 RepID=UPI00106922C1|nr:DUF5107 domain-containing protein [Jeotgalibacillus sp. R-1-5s-1]TFD96988.1 DUF5107 domain-containing protein [Jeotgalibacillus sp. R-1-5s-1]
MTASFKGIDAFILENDSLKAVILPDFGGKLASLYDKKADYEWLYQSHLEELRLPHYGASFGDYTPSGFDEMFPGIDKGPHPLNGKIVPDHGEVWAMPWLVVAKGETWITMSVESPVFPYKLEKTVTLLKDGLEFRYKAENTGEAPFSYIWTPHALLNMNEHTKIEVPEDCTEVITVEKGTKHLGEWGTHHPYPVTTSKGTGEQLDLSRMEPIEAETVEKFYFLNRMKQGWCRTVQEDLGRKLVYTFDPEKVPYLGVWKTHGGFQGDYNFALEPCTGIYDDVYVAEKIDKVSKIPPESNHKWVFTMTLDDVGEME